jgi:hypothetical protein
VFWCGVRHDATLKILKWWDSRYFTFNRQNAPTITVSDSEMFSGG